MIGAISIATARMVEGCIPIAGVVALHTICPKHTGMDGWFCMTGSARWGKPTKIPTGMTLCAIQGGVRSC
jgi:hypothetical protein